MELENDANGNIETVQDQNDRDDQSDRRSSRSRSRSRSRKRSRSYTPDIPIRRGSPSFLEKRRITSARKRPIPYRRKRFCYESPSSESSYSSYSRSSRSYSRS